jgi:hypothetical protein
MTDENIVYKVWDDDRQRFYMPQKGRPIYLREQDAKYIVSYIQSQHQYMLQRKKSYDSGYLYYGPRDIEYFQKYGHLEKRNLFIITYRLEEIAREQI